MPAIHLTTYMYVHLFQSNVYTQTPYRYHLFYWHAAQQHRHTLADTTHHEDMILHTIPCANFIGNMMVKNKYIVQGVHIYIPAIYGLARIQASQLAEFTHRASQISYCNSSQIDVSTHIYISAAAMKARAICTLYIYTSPVP